MTLMASYALVDYGTSEDAVALRGLLKSVYAESMSASFCRPLWDLETLFDEAREDGWDGDGGKAVSRTAFLAARDFLRAFNSGLTPAPDISASPDGEILFEWSGQPRHVFTIAFGSDGEKYYAGTFGTSKVNGREDSVERVVAVANEAVGRICSNIPATSGRPAEET